MMKWLFILTLALFSVPAEDAGIPGFAGSSALPSGFEKALWQKEVPVLCFHHIHPIGDRKIASDYIISESNFRTLIRSLRDSGYHTISPDQYYDYRTRGIALPSKPIMLSFDDSHAEHLTIAARELQQYGYTGVFFVMTVVLGKPNYLSEPDVRALADAGHTIGAHTWDHHDVRMYQKTDWDRQLHAPLQQLQAITGRPVVYFAYPYGAWNEPAIRALQAAGIRAAFQLAEREHAAAPLYTLRRIIVPGNWTVTQLHQQIDFCFD